MIKKIFSLFAAILFAGSMMADPAAAGTTLFSENFGGYSNTDVPSGSVSTVSGKRVVYGDGSVTYTSADGKGSKAGTTKVTTENDGNLAGGTSPELMVGKKGSGTGAEGGSFSVAGIPSGGAQAITVSFKQNNQNLSVSVAGTGYTGSISGKPGAAGERTFDVTVDDGADATFTLTFQAATTSNVRVDDILVTVKVAGTPSGCTNTVTITKGAETNGTYTIGATEVCGDGEGGEVSISDINPAIGYEFDEITTSASGTVDNDNKKVTGITANTTITVLFKEIPKYTVTWDNNGETSTSQVYEGSKPSFPATPESCDATSTTFIGWATEPWAGKIASLGDKTVYTSAEEMPAVDAAVTYYAVFAKSSGSASELFSWAGGGKAGLLAIEGIVSSSLDGDYADSHSPYMVKWNSEGKYLIIPVSAQPGKVSAGFKMIGGATTSTVDVQESTATDGEFTTVETLTISGSTNDIVNVETSNTFKSTTRAIKLLYHKGSNVGLGPISIESAVSKSDYMTTCAAAGQCEVPTFSVAGGTYNEAKSVELDCATEEATIYYTIDGTTPTSASTEYTKAINVAANMTIKAIAVKEGNTDSEVAEAAYTFETATPTITGDENAIISGNYFVDAIEVTLAREGEGEIYYTTDGKTPTAASEHYTGPFWLDKTTTIKAIVIREPWTSGAVAEKEYKYFAVVNCATARIAALSVSENNEVYKHGEVDVFTIRGYVTNMENYSKSNYFWIADEQGTSKVLEVYKPSQKGTGDLALNQAVEVSGKLTKYNTTPEFASGCTFEILADGITTSVDNTVDGKKAVKFIENGQLFIEMNGHIYNVQGQTVK